MAAPTAAVPKPSPTPKGAQDLVIDPQTGSAVKPAVPVAIPHDKDVNWGKSVVAQQAVKNPDVKGRVVKATATYVRDGDTVDFNNLACRVAGVDAPETDKTKYGKKPAQPHALESMAALKKMIARKEVTITVTEEANAKNYGRAVCKIELEGKDVSTEMLKAGAAMIYERYYRGPADRAAQEEAKAKKVGIWSYKTPPVAPWDYRHTP